MLFKRRAEPRVARPCAAGEALDKRSCCSCQHLILVLDLVVTSDTIPRVLLAP